MLILHDTRTQLHRTVEILGAKILDALECPERIGILVNALSASHHLVQHIETDASLEVPEHETVPSAILARTHDAGYLEHLRTCHSRWLVEGIIKEEESVLPECFPVLGLSKATKPPVDIFARPGYYSFDLSTGICKHTWSSAVASAHLAVRAAQAIVEPADHAPEKPGCGQHECVLALCRPPGHHCTTKLAGGYCYLNNAVVAAESIRHFAGPDAVDAASSATAARIAILDLDFHHGNGTQSYFYDQSSTLYVSIHGENEYPYYTGFPEETGEGDGVGFNLNLPLAPRSSMQKYMEKVDIAVARMEEFKPDFLIVSLGFDTFHIDPLGGFDIRTEDYKTIAARIKASDIVNQAPSIILLEGGYVLESLGNNMLQFLEGWEGS